MKIRIKRKISVSAPHLLYLVDGFWTFQEFQSFPEEAKLVFDKGYAHIFMTGALLSTTSQTEHQALLQLSVIFLKDHIAYNSNLYQLELWHLGIKLISYFPDKNRKSGLLFLA